MWAPYVYFLRAKKNDVEGLAKWKEVVLFIQVGTEKNNMSSGANLTHFIKKAPKLVCH